ncbi:MAG: phage tail family protein [Clostridia bacterium]|nr:phage tail family protein [Clostridia bacterium]
MRFNEKDLRDVHRALSIEKEIPPGIAQREIDTVQGTDGEIIAQERIEKDEYIVRVNIACRCADDAWDVRAKLAGWAQLNRPGTAELIPTHWIGKCYDARLKAISAPEFVRGFGKVEMRFLLPRPIARDIAPSMASGAGGMSALIGGTYVCRPTIGQTIRNAREGLTISMDGEPFLVLTGALAAGQRVEMDTQRERLTIDGEDAMSRINYVFSRWRPGFTPGRHEIISEDDGALEMRWHNEWV